MILSSVFMHPELKCMSAFVTKLRRPLGILWLNTSQQFLFIIYNDREAWVLGYIETQNKPNLLITSGKKKKKNPLKLEASDNLDSNKQLNFTSLWIIQEIQLLELVYYAKHILPSINRNLLCYWQSSDENKWHPLSTWYVWYFLTVFQDYITSLVIYLKA